MGPWKKLQCKVTLQNVDLKFFVKKNILRSNAVVLNKFPISAPPHVLPSEVWNTKSPGARFTKVKSLLSYSLTGTFPIKNFTSRENCESRAWWISTQYIQMFPVFVQSDFELWLYANPHLSIIAHFVEFLHVKCFKIT